MTAETGVAPPDATPAGRSATELAGLVRSGVVSAVEVVRAHLAVIDQVNPGVNAFVHVAYDRAIAEAERVDAKRHRGEPLGALAGVPFSVKDVIGVEAMPFTAGSRALQEYVATEDAPAVRRLREAGAICLGKTNTPEFALWTLTWNELFGYTVNPLPPGSDRSPGGSSGGEAAAVAAGMSAFGLGSDFGGSVRWPAHCTGLTSLRPTPGVIPAAGQLPGRRVDGQWILDPETLQGKLQVVGPMARTVGDLRLVTDVLMGLDPRPEATHPAATHPDGPHPEAPGLEGLRISWCDGEGNGPVDPAIVGTVARAAARLFYETGRPAEQHRPAALVEAVGLFGELRATDQQGDIRALTEQMAPGPVIRALLDDTRPVTSQHLDELWRRLDELRRQMLDQMPDILLMPVAAIGAPRLDERVFTLQGSTLGPWDILACCQAISLFGLPAAVVPFDRFHDGRNIGVQVVGRPGQDHLVIAVAETLERISDHGTVH
jgi:amidase